jgi:L-serine dehydratase
MDSIRDIYIIGNGPSSSHTMGPSFATSYILNKYKDIKFIKVVLYASLALTGKGHLTDYIIDKKLNENNVNHEIIFDLKTEVEHPNTMEFIVTLNNDEVIKETILSIGGGSIVTTDNRASDVKTDVYKEKNLTEILKFCSENKLSLYQYVIKNEGIELLDYLKEVLNTMYDAIKRGTSKDDVLPGSLKVKRKAKRMYQELSNLNSNINKEELLTSIAAFAVSEENASGGIVVTAPTCGSSGVIPGVLAYLKTKGFDDSKIIECLAVAGLIGKIVKTNASVSGAVSGCQAEIGVACSMGAAAIMHAYNSSNEKIEQAAEMALEHSLGLTCDPIKGYVQIPCIERNSIFALKAINAANISMIIDKETNLITFDDIVDTMYRTGNDIHVGYRETSTKGMSEIKRFN